MQMRREMQLRCIAGSPLLHLTTENSVLTHRGRENGRHFADDIFMRIFVNENIWIPINISLKPVPKGPINNIPALAQIMAWRRPSDRPLSEPMMVNPPTQICVTRPQWVNLRTGSKIHKHRRGTNSINDAMANRVIIHSLVLILRNVIDPLVSLLNLKNQRPLAVRPQGCHYGYPGCGRRLRSAVEPEFPLQRLVIFICCCKYSNR